MRPFIKVSYKKKFDAIGDTEPTDIEGTLKEFLPPVAFSTEDDFIEGTKALSPKWKPPGQLHKTIRDGDVTYEIWRGNMTDPSIKQMVKRLQILGLLFIEGGSIIVEDMDMDVRPAAAAAIDDRWTVFLMFRKDQSPDDSDKSAYTFVGYSTVHRFFYMSKDGPKATPQTQFELPEGDFDLAQLPCRSRLSQFVILPPFQNEGNGARLYSTIYDFYLNHAPTKVFTVEDPNEAFDDLRDICDLMYLRTVPEFASLRINKDYKLPSKGHVRTDFVDLATIRKVCAATKIAERQFMRCVEMHLLSQLPDSVRPSMPDADGDGPLRPKPTAEDKHLHELWRVWVKMRLYVHNRDALGQLDIDERVQKLDEALDNVALQYARILSICDRRAKTVASSQSSSGKRKIGETEDAELTTSKKARVEEDNDTVV